MSRHLVIDDDHRRRPRNILLIEVAPSEQRNSHHPKIVAVDRVGWQEDSGGKLLSPTTFNFHFKIEAECPHLWRNALRHGYALDAGQSCDAVFELVEEIPPVLGGRISMLWKSERQSKQFAGLEARRDVAQTEEAADHQSRSDQQRDRQTHFSHHQRLSHPAMLAFALF